MLEGLWRRSWSGPAAGHVVFRHWRLLVRVGVHVLSDVVLLIVSPMTVIFVTVAVIVSMSRSSADIVPSLVECGPVPSRISRRVAPVALVGLDGVAAVVSRSSGSRDGPVRPLVERSSRRSARTLWRSVRPARSGAEVTSRIPLSSDLTENLY